MERDRRTALFKHEFELCEVEDGETMVVLSDPESPSEYVSAALAAARELGARVFQIGVADTPHPHLVGVHPLKHVRAAVEAMKAADIVIAFTRPLFTREPAAVNDALSPFRARVTTLPITPERVLAALRKL